MKLINRVFLNKHNKPTRQQNNVGYDCGTCIATEQYAEQPTLGHWNTALGHDPYAAGNNKRDKTGLCIHHAFSSRLLPVSWHRRETNIS